MSKRLHKQEEFGGEFEAGNIKLGDVGSRDSRMNNLEERGQQRKNSIENSRNKILEKAGGR